jgi:DNA repair exonuclease SbcCD nuclease subunit
MPYRFVHAADIHLDSPLRSLALRDPALAELIGTASRRAFVNIVELCLNEQVDALLLAGDLYDGEQTSMKTARFLAAQVARLHEAGIRVFVIRGNHDAMSRITRELTFPESVKVFGGRADAVTIDSSQGGLSIAMHGLSFARPQAPEGLLKHYRPPVPDAVNIGLMHTSLGGSLMHPEYAPCALADLDASGFDYWGLGHIHLRSAAHGRCTVVMPGIPQGRDIGEAGPKSVTLVTIGDDRSVHVEERPTSVAQFERVAVDLTGSDGWRDMVGRIGAALQRKRAEVASEHLVARLTLTGSTALAWRIRADQDLLRGEAEAQAAALGKSWVEKIEIACRAPLSTAPDSLDDPVTELRRLIESQVLGSATYQADVTAIAEELRAQLPPECRGLLGNDSDALQQVLAALVADGTEDVLARLRPGSHDEAA